MKKTISFGLAILFVLANFTTSCSSIKNANNAQKGAGIGVAAGALVGGLIGASSGNAAAGAAIGAAIGGAAGGVIGHKMDKQAREISQSLPGADVQRVGEGIHLTLKEDSVLFDTGKATLTDRAKTNLDKLIPVFTEYSDTNIEIYGYTDNVETPA